MKILKFVTEFQDDYGWTERIVYYNPTNDVAVHFRRNETMENCTDLALGAIGISVIEVQDPCVSSHAVSEVWQVIMELLNVPFQTSIIPTPPMYAVVDETNSHTFVSITPYLSAAKEMARNKYNELIEKYDEPIVSIMSNVGKNCAFATTIVMDMEGFYYY